MAYPTAEPALPERIGKYRILKLLGRGGMGAVFEAEQENPRRTVALKVVNAGVLSLEMRRRFELEAQVLGLLQHPCIAQIHEAGMYESAGGAQPYFAMELIRGVPLSEYARTQELDLRARLELLARICDGMAHAHQRGVIHRDLKPANILVDDEGAPKILDFGLARATDADIQTATLHTDIGQIMGTIPYMSPEQAAGDPAALDARTDIYSLGVVAYQLVSGVMPYAAGGPQVLENLRVVREEEAAPLSSISRDLRGDVETIIGKALQKDPARRYASAADFAADIRRHLNHEPIAARPPSTLYQLSKFARRNRALVIGTAAVFVALVAGLIGTARGFVRASAEAERAKLTSAFLQEILLGIDPAVAQGSDTTLLKRLLDDTAARVEVELSRVPLIEASLHDTMAVAYFAISEFRAALEQARRAQALFEREQGARSEGALLARTKVGVMLTALDDYAAAERELTETLALSVEVRGDEQLETVHLRNELAVLHLDLERSDAAAELFESVLAVRRRELGDEAPETLVSLNCLGLARLQQNRYEEGLALLREVLEVRRRVSGETHPETITAVHNLAGALATMDRYAEAEVLYRECLERTIAIQGAEHQRTLDAQSSLAILMRQTNRYDESVALQEPVVAIYRKNLGPEDPRTLEAEHALAISYRGASRTAEAVALMRHVYQGRLTRLGPEHVETLKSMVGLSSLLKSAGLIQEATALRDAAVELHRRVLGDEHTDTLVVRHDQGVELFESGDLARAEPLLREVLEANRRVVGSSRAPTLRTMLALSKLLHGQKRHAECAPLTGEFLTSWSAIFGDDDKYAGQASADLSECLSGLAGLGEFEPAVRALLAYHQRVLGPDATQSLQDELWLAEAFADQGRHDEAMATFELASERWTQGGVPTRAQAAYGAALAGKQRFDEAQDMLIMAYDDEPTAALRSHTARRLSALYAAWGKPDEAEDWSARADE